MKETCGWFVHADKESETEGGFPTTLLHLIAETNEEASAIICAAMRSGATRITITNEDRYIRDGRRSVRLSGQVEIEGNPGRRHVKPYGEPVEPGKEGE